MKPRQTFTVYPSLPENLRFLQELSYNIYWDWDMEAKDLFMRLDRDLWSATVHNPVKMLGLISQEKLNKVANDDGYLASLERVKVNFNKYLSEPRWFQKNYPELIGKCHIAYFSTEYGLSESVPIYSGGLGMLSGDHLKTASDMGLPLVAIGLLYRQGYFHQYLNADGWQQEWYEDMDHFTLPIKPVLKDEKQLKISVPCLGGNKPISAQVWLLQVGRVPLYLLDTNLEENDQAARDITQQLYGGDKETRIQQEILLGKGGFMVLHELGITPTVCHMNEGHSAFQAIQKIEFLMKEHNISFAEAQEVALAGNVFTTHTAVPAGIDYFSEELMLKYFRAWSESSGIDWNTFATLGKERTTDKSTDFCMAFLAIKMASHTNGVSKLHGVVSRDLWKRIWEGVPVNEIPISSITNGVHIRSWVSPDLASLFDRYIGPRWKDDPQNHTLWWRIFDIPDEELWRTHERRRERLVAFARKRLRKQLDARGATTGEIESAGEVLNPESLTIVFARRFATYKRATLLFRDVARLKSIIGRPNMPIQFIFAGKAHPKDDSGKEFIRKLIHSIHKEGLRHDCVFIEDYDMNVARYLVQGADIWLNTPRRPLEASGTSGMKACSNGCIHFSILDGWWEEGYQKDNGWAIGRGEEYTEAEAEYQDYVDSNACYDLLEKEIVPMYYNRDRAGLPRLWIQTMKKSMVQSLSKFCSHRMLQEYFEDSYLPATRKSARMIDDSFIGAKRLAEWKTNIKRNWEKVHIINIELEENEQRRVGDELTVRANIKIDGLKREDVIVQAYYGELNSDREIVGGKAINMEFDPDKSAGETYSYEAQIPCYRSGRFGFTVRIMPYNRELNNLFETGLIQWA